jgi:hypothetical protein
MQRALSAVDACYETDPAIWQRARSALAVLEALRGILADVDPPAPEE